MKKTQRNVLVTVLIFAIALGVVYFYKNNKTADTTTLSTTATIDWKTYKNDSYLFEFKHPADLSVGGNVVQSGDPNTNWDGNSTGWQATAEFPSSYYRGSMLGDVTFHVYTYDDTPCTFKGQVKKVNGRILRADESNTTSDNLESFHQTYQVQANEDCYEIGIYAGHLQPNGKALVADQAMKEKTLEIQRNIQTVFDRILSSFQVSVPI